MQKLQNIWTAESLHFILLFQDKLGCFLRDSKYRCQSWWNLPSTKRNGNEEKKSCFKELQCLLPFKSPESHAFLKITFLKKNVKMLAYIIIFPLDLIWPQKNDSLRRSQTQNFVIQIYIFLMAYSILIHVVPIYCLISPHSSFLLD